MVKGTIRVSFAGEYAEAKAFAAENGVNASLSAARAGSQRLPMLSLPFSNPAEREAAQAHFARIGWDEDFQEVWLRARR